MYENKLRNIDTSINRQQPKVNFKDCFIRWNNENDEIKKLSHTNQDMSANWVSNDV